MNGSVDLNNKSLSQPATPPRSSPNTTIEHSRSLPNSILRGSRRTSIYSIPLPPHGLSEATAFLSQQLQHQTSERGRSRSRHSTQNTPSNHGSMTPKSRRSVTPNSRISLTPIRSRRSSRRRSSIIITKTGEKLYEPNYQGPITIDYLKFFCKTSIQNQDKINQQQLGEPFVDTRDLLTSDQRNDRRIPETDNHMIQENAGILSPIEKNESKSPLQIQEEFSQSLIIPSDNENILGSFDETKQDVNDVLKEQQNHIDEVSQDEKVSPEKPKPLSYLQKILLAKSKKSSLISRKTSDETPTKETVPNLNDPKSYNENDISADDKGKPDTQFEQDNSEIIDKIDHFAIQDNFKISNSIFPDWRNNSESASAAAISNTLSNIENTEEPSKDVFNDLEPAENSQIATTNDSVNDYDSHERGKEDRLPETGSSSSDSNGQQSETVELAKPQSGELNSIETENEGSNEIDWNLQEPDFALMDDEGPSREPTPTDEIEEIRESHESFSQEDDVTPPSTNAQEGGSSSMANDQVTPENSIISNQPLVEEEALDASEKEIIQEEFFVDNDQSASIFEGIDDNIGDEEETTDDNIQESEVERALVNRAHLARIIPQKRKQSPIPSTGVDVTIRDVSYIVKSIQAHNSLSTSLSSRKKFKKPKSLSKEIVKSIQEKSNEFLDTLMDDLKGYAEHRQSQTVDMKDVLLYLQRINFAGKGNSSNETDINRISELAQKFLPLENLIALDNDLCDTVSPQKKRQK
ncbi:conserved hypothetical protein [Candida dubliniensis CD36]|uniref:CENP-T/Histone H4 histone fold domain-containing protein n=1 Tax=Candida dubliniensis (strain CD36 / ATCC MYA-646 / CBS 7987 / NCPF 3949 / NRRL Y-17841) TaxID=573826 RepID=B9W8G3_CANDC|nr:conserved hypothetical protein [Candida dubliniensis CD36]CAX45034.1 conserved hypothetical protein [Candida dubliniensis CD36]